MLKLGEKIISDIYLGDKKIAKVFWGDKLVYQAGKPIFLDYIVFDGNSYIDTLFKPNPHTTRTVLDCMLLDNTSSGGQGIFGSRPTSLSSINSMNIWFNTSDAPKKLRLDCTGDGRIKSDIIDITQRLLIDCLDKDVTVNGVTYSSTVDKSNTTYLNYSIYLGNFNNVGKPYTKGCKMYVYGFTIYDNGVLIQDLRPCIDPKGNVCFYDMVTKKYFYNQGTGTLKAGGRFVKSILFDGASYIDTGIAKQGTWKIGAKCTEPTNLRNIIGVGGFGGQYCASTASGKWGLGPNHTINVLSSKYTDLIIDFIFTDTDTTATLTADGLSITRSTANRSSASFKLGLNDGNTIKHFIGEVGYVAYYDVDSNLNLDLRPYVNENGVACFKDMVTGKLFYNKGTGTLGYTEK